MTQNNFNTYDFLINDEDETMLLLYARDSSPENPSIELDIKNKTAFLQRNPNDGVSLSNITDEILDSLQDADKLLVCELSIEDNQKETQIIYAYEAEINY